MPRPRSPRSDASDIDMDGLVDQEMEKCKRQLRIMENDRSAYVQESQNMIRRQKSEVDQLESEKSEVLKELRLAESHKNQVMDETNTSELTDLCESKDDKTQEITEEKELHKALDAKIYEWEKKLKSQGKNMGGVHMSRQHVLQTQKSVHTLENRLDKVSKKFNNMLKTNANYREEIDSLRVERRRYEGLYKKSERELTKLRKETGEVIESSTLSYDSRDEAGAKMILLKEKADKDLQQHNAEMKELIRIIDHDRKLKDFMGIKGQERQEDPQLVAWRSRKEEKEAEKKKENQVDSVESYEAAFEKIKQLTDEEDIDLLVNRFIEVEDRNFALFNYVNEQNNMIENLQDEIMDIQLEIEKFKAQGVEMETQRKLILKQLEERQAVASREADEYDDQCKAINKILDQLKAGIESLFNKINCDRSAIDDMLGAAHGVNNNNMIQYLGIIEQRTNNLLLTQARVNAKDEEKYDSRKGVNLLGEGPQPAQQQSHVVPPSVGDEYDSEGSEVSDDDNRPYTRTELQSKVMKTVKKRESAARKEGFKYDLSNAREKTQKKEKKEKR